MQAEKMRKFSLYMKEEELLMLDDAREKFAVEMGVTISRNSYIRSLILGLMKKDVETAPDPSINTLQIDQKSNPYETIDSRIWTVERRVARLETAVDNIDARIHNIERSLSDLQAQMTRNGWILVALAIVSSTLFGVMF